LLLETVRTNPPLSMQHFIGDSAGSSARGLSERGPAAS
jgi:hypothetical protein